MNLLCIHITQATVIEVNRPSHVGGAIEQLAKDHVLIQCTQKISTFT